MADFQYQSFLTPERTDQFWLLLKHILFYGAPVIMIFVALEVCFGVVAIIKGIFTKGNKDDDNDDDYDIYRY